MVAKITKAGFILCQKLDFFVYTQNLFDFQGFTFFYINNCSISV